MLGNNFGYQKINQFPKRNTGLLMRRVAKLEGLRNQFLMYFCVLLEMLIAKRQENRLFMGKVFHDMRQERVVRRIKLFWLLVSGRHFA